MAELDPDFAPFRAKWQDRVHMTDAEALDAYMRAETLNTAPRVEMVQDPGKTGIYVEVDGRGAGASGAPGAIVDMVAEWQAKMDAERPEDPRGFTKHAIVALFAHAVERGPAWSDVMCAAVWLASIDPVALAALSKGDVTLLARFDLDDASRTVRTRMEVLGPPNA